MTTKSKTPLDDFLDVIDTIYESYGVSIQPDNIGPANDEVDKLLHAHGWTNAEYTLELARRLLSSKR